MLKLKNMDGTITICGREVPFAFDHNEGSLSFGDLDSSQAMGLLNTLGGRPLEEALAKPLKSKHWPPAPELSSTPKAEPAKATTATETSAPKKAKRTRRTKAQIAADKAAAEAATAPAEDSPAVDAANDVTGDADASPQPTNGIGTAASPRSAVPEPDDTALVDDGPAFTVVDMTADSNNDPVPDGWAKDDKGQLYCTTCGEIECSCESDAAADAEFDSAIEQPAAKAAAAPDLKIVKGSNQQPEATEIDDPIFDKCAKETRLIPMMDIMLANGIETVDAIYDKCMEWRNAAPALMKIKPDVLDSRLRRAISSVVP